MNHDAKLAQRNLQALRLSRDIDVFTFSCKSGWEVSEFIEHASILPGHPTILPIDSREAARDAVREVAHDTAHDE